MDLPLASIALRLLGHPIRKAVRSATALFRNAPSELVAQLAAALIGSAVVLAVIAPTRAEAQTSMRTERTVRQSGNITTAAASAPAVGENAAAKEQSDSPVNRLRIGTMLEFDPQIKVVGDAMRSLLAPVRYDLTMRTVDPEISAAVLRRPVPVHARSGGYMTIEQGLLRLIGEDNRLVVDHRSRLVAIERMPLSTTDATQQR